MNLIKKLYAYRFELFFYSLILILFGPLFFKENILDSYISPLLFVINVASGVLVFKKQKKQSLIIKGILIIILLVFFYRFFSDSNNIIDYIRFFLYFIFYTLVTFEIISQVWSTKQVNKTVIYGLMSGYISLGLIGFFIFITIEMIAPNSFAGLTGSGMSSKNINDIMYYSYVSLMTIGYGDIMPVTNIAQKASIFVAMIGQFYMVIITAVVVEKYIRFSQKD